MVKSITHKILCLGRIVDVGRVNEVYFGQTLREIVVQKKFYLNRSCSSPCHVDHVSAHQVVPVLKLHSIHKTSVVYIPDIYVVRQLVVKVPKYVFV